MFEVSQNSDYSFPANLAGSYVMSAKTHDVPFTLEALKRLWSYNQETGEFVRLESRWTAGDQGVVLKTGYRVLSVKGRHFLAHRLAWFYVHGEWPSRFIQHVNGNRLDNRIANLREKWSPRDKKGRVILSHERLREVLEYLPETGAFIWKISNGPRSVAGKEAGVIAANGYRYMSVDSKKVLAHRLAWFYVHGVWPKNQIDHINGNPADNRLSNLREATNAQNTRNSKVRSTNTSGFKGVSRYKNRWQARITINYRVIPLGLFDSPEEAYAAYCKASALRHGDFARA